MKTAKEVLIKHKLPVNRMGFTDDLIYAINDARKDCIEECARVAMNEVRDMAEASIVASKIFNLKNELK